MQPYAAKAALDLLGRSAVKPLNKSIISEIAAVAHKLNR
jgi:hypothetical protein